ncbi:MAG: ferritin family protein [Candidatus Hodarchaeales archaeon]|jgi:rubrerythrin
MSKQERIEFYKEQVKLENTIVKKAEKAVYGLENILIRELILGIALDSKKHAGMLNAMINMYTKPTPSIAEEFGEDLKDAIAEHIKLERKAIESYKEKLNITDNESEKLIIKAILNDEKKHHQLLLTIQKMIIEKMTLSEKVLWEMVEESYLDFGE